MELTHGNEIDKAFRWRLGTAEKLARRRKLPHILLPDGSIRFIWEEVRETLQRVPAQERSVAIV